MRPSNPGAICSAVQGHESAPIHTRRVTAFYEHQMRDSGLKLSLYSLLAQLSEIPQLLTTLADRMGIDRTTLTRSLQPLLEQGWVAESSGTDARLDQALSRLKPALPEDN